MQQHYKVLPPVLLGPSHLEEQSALEGNPFINLALRYYVLLVLPSEPKSVTLGALFQIHFWLLCSHVVAKRAKRSLWKGRVIPLLWRHDLGLCEHCTGFCLISSGSSSAWKKGKEWAIVLSTIVPWTWTCETVQIHSYNPGHQKYRINRLRTGFYWIPIPCKLQGSGRVPNWNINKANPLKGL